MLDSAILTHQLELPVAALPSEEPLGQRKKTMRQLGNYKDDELQLSWSLSIWFSGFSFPNRLEASN